MSRTIHITQDEYGFWLMTLEEPDGTLKLLAHHFAKPDHLIQQAKDMASKAKADVTAAKAAGGREIIIVKDPPRKSVSSDPSKWPVDYRPPRPKRARE